MLVAKLYYLPAWTTAELVQTQCVCQRLLRKSLLGEYGSRALWTFLTLWWVEQDELLNLA